MLWSPFFSLIFPYAFYSSILLIALISLLFIRFLFQAIKTLYNLKSSGIKIFIPGSSTFFSLFATDPNVLFYSVMNDIKHLKKRGLFGWLTPLGKPFLVITDSTILSQIIVENQSKLTKHHAFGILEHFRKTDLGSVAAWKVVHRIASKFPINDNRFQIVFARMVDKFCIEFSALAERKEEPVDFADLVREFYWEVVLVMVIGDQEEEGLGELKVLYKTAWTACIHALQQPLAHIFSFYMSLPFDAARNYKDLADKLRTRILGIIKKESVRPSWCILSVIKNEMSVEDQLEVAMEFLFTGASSVTTTLIWMMRHISLDKPLQRKLHEEIDNSHHTTREDITFESIANLPILEATLRETLRMYPPIHIGRLSLEEFTVTDSQGMRVTIPKGTDIMSNPWFFHRDNQHFNQPHNFDHTRFLDKPQNIPFYYPFSMGVRSCPGMRISYNIIKYVVTNLLWRHKIEPIASLETKAKFSSNLMLPVTPTGIFVKLNKREQSVYSPIR